MAAFAKGWRRGWLKSAASYRHRISRESGELGLNFGLRMVECIAQCLNLEHEFHHAVSKLCILGFEPLD
jgi:hypothetical protein